MRDLLTFQQVFSQAMEQAPGATDASALGIVSTAALSNEQRAAVYRQAFFARLVGSLREDFPLVSAALGSDGFRQSVRAYLQAHPSRYATLAEVGRDFPEWLSHTQGPEYLADLAQWEWLCLCTHYADPQPARGIYALSTMSQADLSSVRLVLQRGLGMLTTAWAVDAWTVRKFQSGTDLKCNKRPLHLICYWGQGGFRSRRLARAQWECLHWLWTHPTSTALGALEHFGTLRIPAARIQLWFTQWAASGIVQGWAPVVPAA